MKNKQLEQELEEAANDFYKRNAAFSEEMDNSLNRDIELQQEAFKKGAKFTIENKIHQQGMFTEEQVLKLLKFVALNYYLDRDTNEYVIVDIKEEVKTEEEVLQEFLKTKQ